MQAQARMNNPALILPDAMKALVALKASTEKSGVPSKALILVELRASQINGCSVCVDMHSRQAVKSGETQERLFAVAAWRETPYFTDAERAALALTEALTRIRVDAVAGRRLDRSRAALRRAGARGAGPCDREHQCLEPAQCRGAAAGG